MSKCDENLIVKKKYRWKKRWVKEAVYRKRISQSQSAQKRKAANLHTEEKSAQLSSFGRRFICLDTLIKNMICIACQGYLSFSHITDESRCGLTSTLKIRCHNCLLINSVLTDKQFTNKEGKVLYEANVRIVLGIYDAGMGCTHLNKLLGSLDVPSFNNHLFKIYETEVGIAANKVAQKSCEDAVLLERKLTLKNLESLKEMLPADIEKNFLLPDTISPSDNLSNLPTDTLVPLNVTANSPNLINQFPSSPVKTLEVLDSDRVRIMVSYDMGWSKRGAGRNYDSNNGYGAVIGVFSGLVIDYGTRNRQCRLCNLGQNEDSHDCRANYEGSSKGMEADLSVQLITKSTIMDKAHVQVGILVGDDDSSTISAVRIAAGRRIVKFSDMNHTSKGVTKKLYSIQKEHKELTKDAIEYLHRCFTYAVSQNKGQKAVMADVIRQIPNHAFNEHQKCGQWCGYKSDKENYDHKTIPGGFKDKLLLEALTKIFDNLADNVDKFANASSSQLNESLNAMMASKAPKSRCYNLSQSSDFRFDMVIANKNLGSNYLQKILQFLKLSSGEYTEKYMQVRKKIADRRRSIINTPAFKSRRKILKKYRTIIRKKTEKKEGTTYESCMGLLNQSAVNVVKIHEPGTEAIVFFDLETACFSSTTEILQIAAKFDEYLFDRYITPTKPISDAASSVNKLTSKNGELLYRNKRVESVPLQSALEEFYEFLKSTGKPCVLVAHHCVFDRTRLLYAIEKFKMFKEFSQVIAGFTDTLPIFRAVLHRTDRCKQEILAAEFLGISRYEAHNAIEDVNVLISLTHHLNTTHKNLVEKMETLSNILQKQKQQDTTKLIVKNLLPLQNIISVTIKNRMAKASITFDDLVDKYLENGHLGITSLLSANTNGKVRVTKNVNTINIISEFLSDILKFCEAD